MRRRRGAAIITSSPILCLLDLEFSGFQGFFNQEICLGFNSSWELTVCTNTCTPPKVSSQHTHTHTLVFSISKDTTSIWIHFTITATGLTGDSPQWDCKQTYVYDANRKFSWMKSIVMCVPNITCYKDMWRHGASSRSIQTLCLDNWQF